MSELNQDAERAAQEYARVREEFELAIKFGARFDIDSAMLNVDALLYARRAAPVVGDDGLPPLPERPKSMMGRTLDYSDDDMRDYAASDIAADRAARAQQQAQSVGDSVDFQALLSDVLVASKTGQSVTVVAEKVQALIAYIDGRTAGAAKTGPGRWSVLSDDDKPDASLLLDVILKNGVCLMDRQYSKIDWTQVADWRYAAPSPQQEKEGGND